MQTSPFALVHGESRSRELDAQVEVDQVVLAGKLPVGQRVFGQRRVVLHQLDHQVVLRRASLRHDLGREVGQRDDRGLQLVGHRAGFGLQGGGALLERRDLGFSGFGLLAAALTHQGADLLGRAVLFAEQSVEFDLDGAAAVVEPFDALDDGAGVDPLLGKTADRFVPVVPELLDCKHDRNKDSLQVLKRDKISKLFTIIS